MTSAWGASWGASWGDAWGSIAGAVAVEESSAAWHRHWQALQIEQLRNVVRDGDAKGAVARITVAVEAGDATGYAETVAGNAALSHKIVAGAAVTEAAGALGKSTALLTVGSDPIGDAWVKPTARSISRLKIISGAARVHVSVGGAVAAVRIDGRANY